MRTRHDRVRAACVGGVFACVAIFVALRVELVHQGAESRLDDWIAERIGSEREGSPTFEVLERAVAAPGSRKGGMLISLSVAAWAWLRRRDVRWGALLIAAFTATNATVRIVKIGTVLEPFHAHLDRAYLSEHAANTAAVFGMLMVMSILTHERRLLLLGLGAVAGGVVALVAFSVMAAGHHWFTDVLGGFAVAGAWTFALTPAAHSMWRRPELVRVLRRSRVVPSFDAIARANESVGAAHARAVD
jgi:membrane-associated phospholipid phosphatase